MLPRAAGEPRLPVIQALRPRKTNVAHLFSAVWKMQNNTAEQKESKFYEKRSR